MSDVHPRSRFVTFLASIVLGAGASIFAGCSQEEETEPSGVLLEWLPPSEYDDGGQLPEGAVTEYRIYVDQEMVQQVAPDVTEYFLELPSGEWEVTISTVVEGIESRLSEPMNVVVE